MRDVDPRIARRNARRRQQIRRRRLTALAGVAIGLAFVSGLAVAWAGSGPDSARTETAGVPAPAGGGKTTTNAQGGNAGSKTTTEAATPAKPRKPSDKTKLVLRETLGGEISPKSVVSSGTGLIFAQNMMYRHSVTVYDAKTLELKKTISDSVSLADFGYEGHPGTVQGAPVEAAFSPDGKYGYVSNYSMYGAGFGPRATTSALPPRATTTASSTGSGSRPSRSTTPTGSAPFPRSSP